MFSFLLDLKKGLQKIKFNYKLRFIVFKVSLVFLFALLYNGCASSTSTSPVLSKALTPTKSVDKRLIRYATTKGCTMMKSGYMVCPKSMK